MMNDEFLVAQPSRLWGQRASCPLNLRGPDAHAPHRRDACATSRL
jgi:hypothetical protein